MEEADPLVLPRDEEVPMLAPLSQFSMYIPEGWKDAIYGPDGSGSSGDREDWWLDETAEADGR